MDIYIVVMYCFSLIGIFTIAISMYLLISVSTKLTLLSQFVIHGHDVAGGIFQLYLTLGTTPTFILPCSAVYADGLFQHLGLMKPINQLWSQALLFIILAWFVVFLSLNRVLTISMNISEKNKKNIVISYMVCLVIQISACVIIGLNIEDGGEEARQVCRKNTGQKFSEMMYQENIIILLISKETGIFYACACGTLVGITYTVTAIFCGFFLIRSLREQGRPSRSSHFLKSQRIITIAVIRLRFFEFFGLALPAAIIAFCVIFHLGVPEISRVCFLLISSYQVFGSYFILMANSDYSNRIKATLRKVVRKINCTGKQVSTPAFTTVWRTNQTHKIIN